jgi:hypothetical protein
MPAVNVRRWGMGSPEPRETPIDPFCICRAEQDWQDARSERPATGCGAPEAGLGETGHDRLKPAPQPG